MIANSPPQITNTLASVGRADLTDPPQIAPNNIYHAGREERNTVIAFGESHVQSAASALRAMSQVDRPAYAMGSTTVPVSVPNVSAGDTEIQCAFPECRGRTFGRKYDYDRHYNGTHASRPTVWWCTVVGCDRSAAERGKPFPRKDKRNDHLRKVHSI